MSRMWKSFQSICNSYSTPANSYSVRIVAKTLARTQALCTIRQFILERSLINVRTVAKALGTAQVLHTIREFTLKRNFNNTKNVEKLSVTMQLLLNTSEFILKTSLINVRIVTKTLTQHFDLTYHQIIISLQSRGPSRIFSNTTVQKHQFFGAQLSL